MSDLTKDVLRGSHPHLVYGTAIRNLIIDPCDSETWQPLPSNGSARGGSAKARYVWRGESVMGREKGGLSPVRKEILRFWNDALPLEVVRGRRRLLPEDLEIPKGDADDTELLKFYSSLAPKRISALIESASRLRYPVLDANDLKTQLVGQRKQLGQAEIDLISGLQTADFPLLSSARTIDGGIVSILAGHAIGCREERRDCLRDVERRAREMGWSEQQTERAEEECENEYQRCSEELDPLAILYVMAQISSYRLPLWLPRFPRPFPWPY